MKTVLRIIAVIVIVIALAAGGYWLVQNRGMESSQAASESEGYTQIVAVQQGDLAATISVVGELYAPQNETLTFDRLAEATTLLNVDVEAGYMVGAGQVLANIDPSTYEQALDQARSDLQEAEERLEDLQTPVTELEIATADLAIARAKLARQRALYNRDELLNPDIPDLRVAVAEAQLAQAQAQEDLLDLELDEETADRIVDLKEKEADLSAEYSRIASEGYSDSFYQDRLRVAYEDLLAAEGARIAAEIQQQIDILKAQMALRKADWNLADAQSDLADAEAGGNDLDLATAEQALAQAETDLLEVQENRSDLESGPDAIELATAQADVDKKRLAVAEAEADLAGSDLLAPFAGTILRTFASAGDRINATTDILTIANLDELQVVASIDETTIRQVEVGQPVLVTFDAFPGQTFNGEVLSVPLQGELQGGVMVYDVPISLQGVEDLPLLVGMTANAEIGVGQVENALLIPTMALQNYGGFYQVLVANSADPDAAPESVPVEVGLSNGIVTEIVRGLNPGDQVVIELSGNSDVTDFRAMRQLVGGGRPPNGPPPDRN